MGKPNKRRVFELTELCYDNLETVQALIDLLSKNLTMSKTVQIVLNMVLQSVKKTVEIVLEIQDSV